MLVAGRPAGEAGVMASGSPLRRYLGAMNIAAFFTWVVLVVLLFDSSPRLFLNTRLEGRGLPRGLPRDFHHQGSATKTRARSALTCAVLFAVEGALALLTNVFWARLRLRAHPSSSCSWRIAACWCRVRARW